MLSRSTHTVLRKLDCLAGAVVADPSDGEHIYISVKFPLKKGSGETFAVCGISTDITERKRAENRIAVFFLDLDDFKKVNDTLGHEVGDRLLLQAAERLRTTVRKADTALYHAKEQGRNTYHFFTGAMNREVTRRLTLEQHLHGALARGEFYLRYQPLVKISDRAITGFEALLRWNSPVLGEVSPVEFIPVAEQTGLIIPIGRYVLTAASSKISRSTPETVNWSMPPSPWLMGWA